MNASAAARRRAGTRTHPVRRDDKAAVVRLQHMHGLVGRRDDARLLGHQISHRSTHVEARQGRIFEPHARRAHQLQQQQHGSKQKGKEKGRAG